MRANFPRTPVQRILLGITGVPRTGAPVAGRKQFSVDNAAKNLSRGPGYWKCLWTETESSTMARRKQWRGARRVLVPRASRSQSQRRSD